MELKLVNASAKYRGGKFQSYLHGIEMGIHAGVKAVKKAFQSYLHGIEIKGGGGQEEKPLRFQSYLHGIEITNTSASSTMRLVPIVPSWN